jgi:hypothetical protein
VFVCTLATVLALGDIQAIEPSVTLCVVLLGK